MVEKFILALNLYGLKKKRLYGYDFSKAFKKLCELLKSDASIMMLAGRLAASLQTQIPERFKELNLRDPDVFRHDIDAAAQALHKFCSELPESLPTMAYYTAFRKR